MPNDPPFYPETAAEAHGLTPDMWHDPAVYALTLNRPRTVERLRERWAGVYTVPAPDPLVDATRAEKTLLYLGATNDLLARLADHVRGDVRQAGVLAVCPATGVREIWKLPSAEAAFERETGIAIDYSNSHPGVLVACNGSWF